MGDVQKEEYVLQDLYILMKSNENPVKTVKESFNCVTIELLPLIFLNRAFADQMVVGISCNMEYNIS